MWLNDDALNSLSFPRTIWWNYEESKKTIFRSERKTFANEDGGQLRFVDKNITTQKIKKQHKHFGIFRRKYIVIQKTFPHLAFKMVLKKRELFSTMNDVTILSCKRSSHQNNSTIGPKVACLVFIQTVSHHILIKWLEYSNMPSICVTVTQQQWTVIFYGDILQCRSAKGFKAPFTMAL